MDKSRILAIKTKTDLVNKEGTITIKITENLIRMVMATNRDMRRLLSMGKI